MTAKDLTGRIKRKSLYGSDDYFINTNMVYVFGKKAGDFASKQVRKSILSVTLLPWRPVVNQLSVCLLRIARMYWNLQLWSLPKTGDILLHIDSKLLKGKKEAF